MQRDLDKTRENNRKSTHYVLEIDQTDM